MLKVNYVEDTRPIKSVVLVQPKGTFDLTLSKNAKGNRIRISNKEGNVINVATTEIANFVEALNKVNKSGVKLSRKAA